MIKLFQQELSVSNMAPSASDIAVYDIVKRKLAMEIAESIVNANMIETKHDNHKVFSMKVIVATEEDFYKAVAEYSENINRGYPLTLNKMLDTQIH